MSIEPITQVAILENQRGGLSLFAVDDQTIKHSPTYTETRKVLRNQPGIGNYATLADAQARAAMNAYEVVALPQSKHLYNICKRPAHPRKINGSGTPAAAMAPSAHPHSQPAHP